MITDKEEQFLQMAFDTTRILLGIPNSALTGNLVVDIAHTLGSISAHITVAREQLELGAQMNDDMDKNLLKKTTDLYNAMRIDPCQN